MGKCVGVWCGKVLGKVWGKYEGGVGKCVGGVEREMWGEV